MDSVRISDIGHALITFDLELDRLTCEQAELELKLEHCKARQAIIQTAVDRLLDTSVYQLGVADAGS